MQQQRISCVILYNKYNAILEENKYKNRMYNYFFSIYEIHITKIYIGLNAIVQVHSYTFSM